MYSVLVTVSIDIHCVPKNITYVVGNNFVKSEPIFKILSLLESL